MPTNYSTLNSGQKAVAEQFLQFLLDDNEKGFILSGRAGTGKTFLLGFIVDHILPQYHELMKALKQPPKYQTIAMTATTNKAADVLSNAVRGSVTTIQTFMNLVVTNDFTTGKSFVKRIPNRWKVHEDTIIFVDECSMIDTDLFKAILEGTIRCKLVFIGERHQLAPVTEKLSPVYLQGYPMGELLEPVRNSGKPELINLCDQLRATVQTGVFQPIQVVPGIFDYVEEDELEEVIAHFFAQQTMDERIIAYTNAQVNMYNDGIRELRQLPMLYQKGELLVNGSAVKVSRDKTIPADITIKVLATYEPELETIKYGGESHELWVQKMEIVCSRGQFIVKVPCYKERYAQLLKYFKGKKWYPAYYDLKDYYADLRPTDASTIHKAQGSTFRNVFVDLANISTCNMADQVARMLYVAVSRPSQRLFLIGDLAAKYGGLLR